MKLPVMTIVLGMFVAGSLVYAGFPEGWDANSPVFRGPNGNGFLPKATAVTEWSEADSQNILWKVALGGPGWSSPVAWGDKVVVTSADQEVRRVHCYNAATGEQMWLSEVPSIEGTTDDYELDTMDPRWDEIMHAAATPATDGKLVFTLFSNGQLSAFDLADGAHKWSVALGDSSFNTYGVANSLLVYGGNVIAVFEGDPSIIAAYDKASGKEVWKSNRSGATWGSPVLAENEAGRMLVIVFADPNVTAWDAGSGEQVWNQDVLTRSPEYCVGPSPTVAGGVVAVNADNCGIYGLNINTGEKLWEIEDLPDGSGFPDGASMATDGKLLYQYFEFVLTIINPADGEVVKQMEVDEFATYASPLVIGDKLYLFADHAAVVLTTGVEPSAVGTAAMNEGSDSTPAVAGGRIFIRTDDSLYAIGK